MDLNELNHRSPMRVFERSVHGGLGRGNLGLIASRAGVGKNAFATGLGLDHLLRGERVLHVALHQTVDHVRERYDELFNDLASSANLEERNVAHETVDGHRIIRSLLGDELDLGAFDETLATLKEHADFCPDVMIVTGFHFDRDDAKTVVEGLLKRAADINAQLWMTVQVPRLEKGDDWHDIPEKILPLGDLPAVIVRLQSQRDNVRIRLLKDHDNETLTELDLDLDPTTLLVKTI